jgi:hypothetical protein
MNNNNNSTFKLLRLFYPRLDGSFIRQPKSNNYNQAFRVLVQIIGDKNLIVLFGISLTSEEKLNDKPVAGLITEVAAEIELSENLSEVNSLKDIPLSGNMLALLFPFLREKVNYFFSNNHVLVLLNPINTMGLASELKVGAGLELIDLRKINNPVVAESQS